IGDGATANVVAGNYLGTDASGTLALGNANGVTMVIGASGNLVGGTDDRARNLIAGNTFNGVGIAFSSNGNTVEGNYIGTDVTGRTALGNSLAGVSEFEAFNNTIGGTERHAGNLISGNFYGLRLEVGGQNVVQGNYIGTDVTGTRAVGNVFGISAPG